MAPVADSNSTNPPACVSTYSRGPESSIVGLTPVWVADELIRAQMRRPGDAVGLGLNRQDMQLRRLIGLRRRQIKQSLGRDRNTEQLVFLQLGNRIGPIQLLAVGRVAANQVQMAGRGDHPSVLPEHIHVPVLVGIVLLRPGHRPQLARVDRHLEQIALRHLLVLLDSLDHVVEPAVAPASACRWPARWQNRSPSNWHTAACRSRQPTPAC